MARYVYHCACCQKKFEVEKSMALSGLAEKCPICQQTGERVFTAPGIAVKGSPVRTPCAGEVSGPSECSGGCCHGNCSLH
ncbi:MAG: FmdB family transcriptional regulator [Candidatus Firestonebacteria bacterium]|nr:FmdB family transcriptional regulator [Candidatus Firestonebacteria bacterium]